VSWQRKLAFSLLTVALVMGVIEGIAQIVWWRLEADVFARQMAAGERILRNDAVGFMKVAHGEYGYTMKPGFRRGSVAINSQGFHQTDEIPVARREGYLRIACLGESTTFGNAPDSSYPGFLRSILTQHAGGFRGYEVINAGVPGWVSDQVALRAEREVARFAPDVVILYLGWNDFQSYTPFAPPPSTSYFTTAYEGREWKQQVTGWSKSLALASAWYHSGAATAAPSVPTDSGSAGQRYRFLWASIDRIAAAVRRENPEVKIVVSTLVGRWPHGTPEEWAKIPSVWWMTQNGVTPQQAAAHVSAFNDALRQFAADRRLTVVDTAAAFDSLDRARLQYDWAHMYSDGYELMAWTMFSRLVAAEIVDGNPAEPRHTELRSRYQLAGRVAAGPVKSGS
jgi:hypothetical protein